MEQGRLRVSALDPQNANPGADARFPGRHSAQTLVNLRDNQTIIDQSFADSNGYFRAVGDRMRMLTQTGKDPPKLSDRRRA